MKSVGEIERQRQREGEEVELHGYSAGQRRRSVSDLGSAEYNTVRNSTE